ncbi:3530bca0-13ef-4f71-a779-f6466cdba68a [Thermothielavioides terrestris]|uniref:3530bca0-13ef-4f71-a779-f6466cdba68a n=1 Tax=Thermothielavioides terrestris TaxID=2587410 RepID=A0A3S5CXI8_9PEZI|nr:3530bca0-13ef-4f71-a779-f6466cdba68a [Thermothielavioides terrestris]
MSKACPQDLEFLRTKDLALTQKIVYTRRCIRPVRGDVDRDVVANVSSPLVTTKTILNLADGCSSAEPPPCEPLSLHVPPAYPKPEHQYQHLVFGVASSYGRLQDALPTFAHWLSGSGAALIVVVADADQPDANFDLAALEAAYRNLSIDATVIAPKLKTGLPRKDTPANEPLPSPAPVEQLHFLLIRDMLEFATPQTQWLGVLDDDTFFPSLHPLSGMLQQHNHSAPVWLGALADNLESIRKWGYMSYGGAGVFLSMPLARQLAPHLDSCIRKTTIISGDGMLRDCIYLNTPTKLTVVPELYQHDMRGDPAGFYESGRRVLSVHHWKSWYNAPVDKMAAVVRVCGDCFLQRFRLGDDTLLANGYSVSVYRAGLLPTLDLGRIEGTWGGWGGSDFDFKSYRLVGVAEEPAATVNGVPAKLRQFYVHRTTTEEEKKGKDSAMDEVIELVWEG